MASKRLTIDIDPADLFNYVFEIDPTVSMEDLEAFLDLYEEGLQQAAIDAVNRTLSESVRNWIDKRLTDKREPNLPELDDDDYEAE